MSILCASTIHLLLFLLRPLPHPSFVFSRLAILTTFSVSKSLNIQKKRGANSRLYAKYWMSRISKHGQDTKKHTVSVREGEMEKGKEMKAIFHNDKCLEC